MFMRLIGLIAASITGIFWHSSALQFLNACVGVLVFTDPTCGPRSARVWRTTAASRSLRSASRCACDGSGRRRSRSIACWSSAGTTKVGAGWSRVRCGWRRLRLRSIEPVFSGMRPSAQAIGKPEPRWHTVNQSLTALVTAPPRGGSRPGYSPSLLRARHL
jgi:hypothetical protein